MAKLYADKTIGLALESFEKYYQQSSAEYLDGKAQLNLAQKQNLAWKTKSLSPTEASSFINQMIKTLKANRDESSRAIIGFIEKTHSFNRVSKQSLRINIEEFNASCEGLNSDAIISKIVDYYNVPIEKILSDRKRETAPIRRHLLYLLRAKSSPKLTYYQLINKLKLYGSTLNDHSTVIHAIKKYCKQQGISYQDTYGEGSHYSHLHTKADNGFIEPKLKANLTEFNRRLSGEADPNKVFSAVKRRYQCVWYRDKEFIDTGNSNPDFYFERISTKNKVSALARGHAFYILRQQRYSLRDIAELFADYSKSKITGPGVQKAIKNYCEAFIVDLPPNYVTSRL